MAILHYFAFAEWRIEVVDLDIICVCDTSFWIIPGTYEED